MADVATILSVASELDRWGLTRNARRLREAVDAMPQDERPFPIQDATRQYRSIPWSLAEFVYPAYGHDQTLERLAERGGFSRKEIGMLSVDLYHDTRPRLQRMPLLDIFALATAHTPEDSNGRED